MSISGAPMTKTTAPNKQTEPKTNKKKMLNRNKVEYDANKNEWHWPVGRFIFSFFLCSIYFFALLKTDWQTIVCVRRVCVWHTLVDSNCDVWHTVKDLKWHETRRGTGWHTRPRFYFLYNKMQTSHTEMPLPILGLFLLLLLFSSVLYENHKEFIMP